MLFGYTRGAAAAVRGGRHGRARRRQSREGLRLVLLRQHVARHQQRVHGGRQPARPPSPRLDLRLAYKRGFTGSKVERLPSYWASKRNDDALRREREVQVHSSLSVFGEYARYVWGPTETSAEMLGVDAEPIDKPGYYFGATFECRSPRARVAA